MEMPTPRSRGTDSIEILVRMKPAELREAIDILGNAKKLLYTSDDTPPDFVKRSYICLAMNSAYREDKTSVFYNLRRYFNRSCIGTYQGWLDEILGYNATWAETQEGRHLWVQQVINTMGGWLEPVISINKEGAK